MPGGTLRGGDADIGGVTLDSRRVVPGDLFLAVPGDHTDGHHFASHAFRRGAAALVVEHPLPVPLPQLLVPSVPAAAGPLASAFYGDRYEGLRLVGVTGTNGKTTICRLLRACLGTAGAPAGQVGTTGAYLGDRLLSASSLTTPEAPELHALLARMGDAGAGGVAVEVSSHGLVRHRVDGIHFDVAVFTHLSREHLDFHRTMERYFAAKSRLFAASRCRQAIVGVDDEWGRRLAASCPVPVTTFGSSPEADVRIEVEARGLEGLTARLHLPDGEIDLDSPLIGRVNGANVAAAYLAARAAGVRPDDAADAIANCPAPPGRFEIVTVDEPFLAVTDYAHTPDSLAQLVDTARELATGSVYLVLGARGGRYAQKRAEMGRVAARADRVTLTADSPGDEDPAGIAADLLAGVSDRRRFRVTVELDRATAIRRAVESLGAGDVLLVTGRGHEGTQRFGGSVVTMDDRIVTRLALGARRARRDDRSVAAVIAARNAGTTLRAAIHSILAQSIPVEEVIVVDDGSTDDTFDAAQDFGAPVRVLQQPRLGPAAARNAGIAAARSQWIAFCDADDEWHPHRLAVQMDAVSAQPDSVLCATGRDRPGTPAPGSPTARPGICRFGASTVLARRDALCHIGGFASEPDAGGDWDCWLRLSRLGTVISLAAPPLSRGDSAATRAAVVHAALPLTG